MSGLVTDVDLCAVYAPYVYGGRVDSWTVIAPGTWRGTTWPCPGRSDPDGPVGIVVACTCACHAGGEPHALPPSSDPVPTVPRR